MKAEYKDNSSMPAGNGYIILTDEEFPNQPWQMSIQRSSDQKFLSGKNTGQWLGENIQFPVQDAEILGDTLQIALTPVIVDSLDQKDQYRITLRGSDDEPHVARLKINNIVHSAGNMQDKTARIREKPAPVAEKKAEIPPQPKEDKTPLEMPPVSQAGEISGKRTKKWAFPLILLLCALCILWWYVDPRKNAQSDNPPAQVPEKTASAKPQKSGALADTEREVREFFAGSNLTPVNALALARSLPANTPAEKDAIYRLYYYAATSTNPSGLLEYGKCLDPSTPEWGTIEKNAVEAWSVYRQAAKTNPEEAKAAEKNLLDWLEKRAAEHDRKAAEWLGSIQK